ncbi:hypothetical protein EYF80_014902 [Liparis tanakae]|uniref:Uncharacterized protein n=1 Tax=Liparis tanakae TaxID=230148 RepID=A0A4Z2IBL3_9TELE|nr:hypothetical protein EYF80_014902 [Liparis tanakae]
MEERKREWLKGPGGQSFPVCVDAAQLPGPEPGARSPEPGSIMPGTQPRLLMPQIRRVLLCKPTTKG